MKQLKNRGPVIRISKQNTFMVLCLALLTFPFMNPGYFNQNPVLDILINGWRLISFAIILLWTLAIKRRISHIVILVGIMQIYLLVNTIIKDGEVYSSVITAFSILSVVMLYDLALADKKNFFSSQLLCFEVVVYINLLTQIIYPEGMYITRNSMFIANRNWFLGFYNNHSQYFIPALLIAYLYMYYTRKKVRTYMITIAVFVSALMVWSGGVVLALAVMAIVYILLKNRTHIFNYYSYWCIHLIFFVGIIVLKFQNAFKWLIDDILGKWNSLEVRMQLWDKYLGYISQAFWTGYGAESGLSREIKSGFYWAMHAHNQLLEILYYGGIIYLILFVILVVLAGKRVGQFRNTMESKIIAIAFLGWCIHSLVEPFTTAFLMGMFVIAYHSNSSTEVINR